MFRGDSRPSRMKSIWEASRKRYLGFFLVAALSLFACPLFAQTVPEIAFDSAPNLLKTPADIYLE
jgi:hypothetical protein